MVLPGDSRIPLAGRHRGKGRKGCFPDQIFTTLSDFTYILRFAFPCVGACNGLAQLHVRAEQPPFLFPRIGFPLPALGEGGHRAVIRRWWSKGIFLVLLFRCVSQLKSDKHSP